MRGQEYKKGTRLLLPSTKGDRIRPGRGKRLWRQGFTRRQQSENELCVAPTALGDFWRFCRDMPCVGVEMPGRE